MSLPLTSLLVATLSFATSGFAQQTSLKTTLEEISGTIPAHVGVAIIDLQTNQAFAINGDDEFPMQSVFKLHLALAALHLVDEGKLSLDQNKPGTGDRNGEVFSAVNDVGILILPGGRKIVIAAFVTRARAELNEVEKVIAKISGTVYEYYRNPID